MGYPTVYPTGVTIYNKDKAFNGYTVFPCKKGTLLIDMNGNERKLWSGFRGFPSRILPGGYVMGSTGARKGQYAFLDQLDLAQVDWDGHIVWKFDHVELIHDDNVDKYAARQNHDYQREGSSAGYYSPEETPLTNHGNTLLVSHKDLYNHNISDKPLLDDYIIEVDWKGNIVWEWLPNEHFEELGFGEDAKNTISRNIDQDDPRCGKYDYLCINALATLGPNHWYDEGDERFHPDNIIFDARNANILAIISKKTGKIVWRLGPDFDQDDKVRKLGLITGQHHFHMIPKGLPGEGDLMVFDNGGSGGYGAPNPMSPTGVNHAARGYSRVIQFNPVTLEVTWQFTPAEAGHHPILDGNKFYSPYISSAQRLPNGNTLIDEGADGRFFEVTPENEIVWEYINPYYENIGEKLTLNKSFRAYRVPYEWVPQLERPTEKSIEPLNVTTYRVPDADKGGFTGKVTVIDGVDPNRRTFIGGSGYHKKKFNGIL